MRGFIEDIPRELEEAAWVDGCSRFQAIWRIIFPLVAPGLAATAIFCVIQSWNEFALAFFLTSFNAVSYTHLDVYKRQVLEILLTGYMRSKSL